MEPIATVKYILFFDARDPEHARDSAIVLKTLQKMKTELKDRFEPVAFIVRSGKMLSLDKTRQEPTWRGTKIYLFSEDGKHPKILFESKKWFQFPISCVNFLIEQMVGYKKVVTAWKGHGNSVQIAGTPIWLAASELAKAVQIVNVIPKGIILDLCHGALMHTTAAFAGLSETVLGSQLITNDFGFAELDLLMGFHVQAAGYSSVLGAMSNLVKAKKGVDSISLVRPDKIKDLVRHYQEIVQWPESDAAFDNGYRVIPFGQTEPVADLGCYLKGFPLAKMREEKSLIIRQARSLLKQGVLATFTGENLTELSGLSVIK